MLGAAAHRELLAVDQSGSYSRWGRRDVERDLSGYGCGLKPIFGDSRLHRGFSPRATPGATDRELLPIVLPERLHFYGHLRLTRLLRDVPES